MSKNPLDKMISFIFGLVFVWAVVCVSFVIILMYLALKNWG